MANSVSAHVTLLHATAVAAAAVVFGVAGPIAAASAQPDNCDAPGAVCGQVNTSPVQGNPLKLPDCNTPGWICVGVQNHALPVGPVPVIVEPAPVAAGTPPPVPRATYCANPQNPQLGEVVTVSSDTASEGKCPTGWVPVAPPP
jgi:hypothetical protein